MTAASNTSESEIVARRRAAKEKMEQDDLAEANKAMEIANKLHERGERSRSKGPRGQSAEPARAVTSVKP